MSRLLLVPSPDLRDDADLMPAMLHALTSGGYAPDHTGTDARGENLRVLRPAIAGLPILALGRGSDEDGSSSLDDAIACLSRPLETDATLPRLKAGMLALMRSAGPARPDHPSMLCCTASPWCDFAAQSYTSFSDQADLPIAPEVVAMIPPAVIVQRANLNTGEQCLRLTPIYSVARTQEVMDVDVVETLRVLKDLSLHPLASSGEPA
jgi:hypothetical protein